MNETAKTPCPKCGTPINRQAINFHFQEVHHLKWSDWRDAHNSNLVRESRLSASFVQQTLESLRSELKSLIETRDECNARYNTQIAVVTADIRCLEKAIELAAPTPSAPPIATTLPTPIHPMPQDDPHNILQKTEPAPSPPGKPRKKRICGRIRSPYKTIGQVIYKGRTFYIHDKPFDRMLVEIATLPVGEPFKSECIRKIVIEMEPRNHECHAQAYLHYLVREGHLKTNGYKSSHRRYLRVLATVAPAGQLKLEAIAPAEGRA